MTQKPAVPAASTPPYPAHPLPLAQRVEADDQSDSRPRREARGSKVTVLGAAVGIGSAAIVAALLYAGRRRA